MRLLGIVVLTWGGVAWPCMIFPPAPLERCVVREWRPLSGTGDVHEYCDEMGCNAIVSPGGWRFPSHRGELIAILDGRAVIEDFTLVTPTGVLHPSAALTPDQLRALPPGPCGGRYEEGTTHHFRRVGLTPEGLVMEAMQNDGPPVRVLLDANSGAVKPYVPSGCRGVTSEGWTSLAMIAGQLDFSVEHEGDRLCLEALSQLAHRTDEQARVAEEWLALAGRRSWRSARWVSRLDERLTAELTERFCVLSRRFQLSVLMTALLPIVSALLWRLGSRRIAVTLGALAIAAALSALTFVPSIVARWDEAPPDAPDTAEVMRQALATLTHTGELTSASCPSPLPLSPLTQGEGEEAQKPMPPSTSMVRPVK